MTVSLLDLSEKLVSEWYVVYFHRVPYYNFSKYLKPGFRHLELAKPIYFGPGLQDVAWQHLIPSFERLNMELSVDPRPPWVRCPGSTIQKVTVVKPDCKIRSWFDIGPPTCVEVAKMALGINAFFVRTPWQLYKHIRKCEGVIT